MRNGILFLPFVAVFSGVLALAAGKAYQDIPAVGISFWVLAAIAFIAWIVLDAQSLRTAFTRKGARHGISQGLSVVLAILLAVGFGYLTKRERFNKSFDLTKSKANTLSEESIKLVNQIRESKQEVSILSFFQDEAKKIQFTKLLGLYERQGLPFKNEFIDPQADPTRAMGENVTVPDTVIFKLNKQEARLTTFSEEKLTNALIRILKDKERTVYFTVGHGEPDLDSQEPIGYSLAKTELESERLVVKKVNLIEAGRVPEDADLLVIAGPKYDLQPGEKALIDAYLQEAKPLLLLVNALADLPNLEALSEDVGVRLNDDLLILSPEDPRTQLLGQNNAIITELDAFSPITADFAKRGNVALVTPYTRSLEIIPENKLQMKVSGLAKTSNIVIKVRDVKTEADLKGGVREDRIQTGSFDVFAIATGQVGGDKLAAAEGPSDAKSSPDVKGDAASKSAKELRVFVGGTANLASNSGAQRGENLDLFVNAVNYLLQDEDFLSIRAKDADPSRLDITTASSQFLIIFLAFIYPCLFLGAGSFYWMQRRRA